MEKIVRNSANATVERSMPEVPTIAESGKAFGLGGFEIDTWFGLFGPAKLPADVTLKLNKAFVDALNSPELKARLGTLMAESLASTSDQFGAFVRAEHAKYQRIVKSSGATIE